MIKRIGSIDLKSLLKKLMLTAHFFLSHSTSARAATFASMSQSIKVISDKRVYKMITNIDIHECKEI